LIVQLGNIKRELGNPIQQLDTEDNCFSWPVYDKNSTDLWKL